MLRVFVCYNARHADCGQERIINPKNTPLRPLQVGLHLIEAAILLVTTVAFWHHSPPIRDHWVWLIGLAVPVFALRLLLFRRLWVWNPLLLLIGVFLLLTPLNYAFAPYHRESFLVLVCRPMLGAWLVVFCAEHARLFRRMDALLVVSLSAGMMVGILALTASQWNDKIAPLRFLVDALPHVDYKTILPDMLLSFNPNEIAGAIAWLCPLAAGIAVYVNAKVHAPQRAQRAAPLRVLFAVAVMVCGLLFYALFLGQSRFALMGVMIALGGIVLLGVRARHWRYGLMGLLVLVALLQIALIANLLPVPGQTAGIPLSLNDRDQESFSTRFDIWRSAITMTRDYPLTGIGMAMFRSAVRKPGYQIALYEQRNNAPPHAHNEWLQIAADLGLPGLLIFSGLQVLVARFLWQAWRSRELSLKALALAVGGGWLAHGVYALGDAVTLWDRYQFIFWWMLGLAAALAILRQDQQLTKNKPLSEQSEETAKN